MDYNHHRPHSSLEYVALGGVRGFAGRASGRGCALSCLTASEAKKAKL
jgi:hypothetical protein